MKFIGRRKEQDKLNALLQAPEQNAALIYGRRRVGKSELILECFRRAGIRTIYYECRQTTTADNTRALAEVISETFDLPRLAFDSIEDVLASHSSDQQQSASPSPSTNTLIFVKYLLASMASSKCCSTPIATRLI